VLMLPPNSVASVYTFILFMLLLFHCKGYTFQSNFHGFHYHTAMGTLTE